MTTQRRQHSAEFKAKVALEAIRGERTINELAGEYGVHPVQITQWKEVVLEAVPQLFSSRRGAAAKEEAIEWAKKLPLRELGAVEVRPARTGAQWRGPSRGGDEVHRDVHREPGQTAVARRGFPGHRFALRVEPLPRGPGQVRLLPRPRVQRRSGDGPMEERSAHRDRRSLCGNQGVRRRLLRHRLRLEGRGDRVGGAADVRERCVRGAARVGDVR